MEQDQERALLRERAAYRDTSGIVTEMNCEEAAKARALATQSNYINEGIALADDELTEAERDELAQLRMVATPLGSDGIPLCEINVDDEEFFEDTDDSEDEDEDDDF